MTEACFDALIEKFSLENSEGTESRELKYTTFVGSPQHGSSGSRPRVKKNMAQKSTMPVVRGRPRLRLKFLGRFDAKTVRSRELSVRFNST